jgi:hypothetical protein
LVPNSSSEETDIFDAASKTPVMQAFLDGAYRDRTGDLRLAKPALSQLS